MRVTNKQRSNAMPTSRQIESLHPPSLIPLATALCVQAMEYGLMDLSFKIGYSAAKELHYSMPENFMNTLWYRAHRLTVSSKFRALSYCNFATIEC